MLFGIWYIWYHDKVVRKKFMIAFLYFRLKKKSKINLMHIFVELNFLKFCKKIDS